MEFREMPPGDAKARFGDLSLQDLLKPEVLQKIFNEEPPKSPERPCKKYEDFR